jgi:hypothetical protein
MSKQELPKTGEVWGVPDEPTTWMHIESVSETLVYYAMFNEFNHASFHEWFLRIEKSKSERIFPPIQATTGPWPLKNWVQET